MSEFEVHPREIADKSRPDALTAAIKLALSLESDAVRRNTQTFNRNRYRAIVQLPDYELLKDRARQIKEFSLNHLPELITRLQEVIEGRGGHFYLAKSAEQARTFIADVCEQHGARSVVKSKSITSEEIELNPELERRGIEVVETDLAEFILQVADEQPSHIVGPALHYSRERISALFERIFKPDEPLNSGEDLTRFARDRLRRRFLEAEVGISGANLVAADTGTLMLVESEANIRLTTTVPPVHIALAGIEKIVPRRSDLAPFVELIGPSATGQMLTSYVSLISPPLQLPLLPFADAKDVDRAFYLVLIDNGRMMMREDPVLEEALYCIRCGACLNSCANFQAVGGHAFGGRTYSGGIGGAWEAGTGKLQQARFSELCTGCTRCVPQCPVRIDIPWLNTTLRKRLNQETPSSFPNNLVGRFADVCREEQSAPLQKLVFGNYHHLARWGCRTAAVANRAMKIGLIRVLLEKTVGIDRRRRLPPFPSRTLIQREARQKRIGSHKAAHGGEKVFLFADTFTNYSSPERGEAALELLRALGIEVQLSLCLPTGRSALSQGLIETARKRAEEAASYLSEWIDRGWKIVTVEPTVLGLFRAEYRRVLDNRRLVEALSQNSKDIAEFLVEFLRRHEISVGKVFRGEEGQKIFLHRHCQQRTARAEQALLTLFSDLGAEVVMSTVECCGMAGSFGYKRDYYELSMAVGEQLFEEVEEWRKLNPDGVILASGISCQEQLFAKRIEAIHPAEFLRDRLSV